MHVKHTIYDIVIYILNVDGFSVDSFSVFSAMKTGYGSLVLQKPVFYLAGFTKRVQQSRPFV